MSDTLLDTQRIELGPDSLLWRYAGDTRIALMGASIGLLQLMHPAIGAGVTEHSNFFEDPADRIFRSLPRILGAVYDADAAATGLEVREFHRDIKGRLGGGEQGRLGGGEQGRLGGGEQGRLGGRERYHALDPATFWWAHATFQHMAEGVVDRFDRHQLTRAERDQLYVEGVEWYRRYGVSDRCVPVDRTAFQAEWDRVCREDLEVNHAVRFVLRSLEQRTLPKWDDRAPLPPWLRPLANVLPARWVAARGARIVAFGGLPSIVRRRFDLTWGPREVAEYAAVKHAVRWGWPLVPASVRWQPRALEGWQRTTGRVP